MRFSKPLHLAMMKLLFLLLPSAVSMPDVSSAPSSLDISRKARAKFQIYDNNGAVVGGDPATSCLPPHTVVGSEGCCTSTASPGKVAACSKTETPYGHCARNTLYPKPTPPHYHIAGQCPRRRPRPRLCLRRRPYLHCALVSQRRGLDQKSLTFTTFSAPSPSDALLSIDSTCETNDPNAPFYDALHGVYHLFWQKHCATPVPGETIKGIVYGHAVSRFGQNPPLATDNLLENTDGVSRGGSLLPSSCADARCIDAVVVSGTW